MGLDNNAKITGFSEDVNFQKFTNRDTIQKLTKWNKNRPVSLPMFV